MVLERTIPAQNKGTENNDALWKKMIMVRDSDPWITAWIVILMIFGTIMVISTQLGSTVGDTGSLIRETGKQLFYVAAGLLIMNFVSRVFSYRLIKRFWLILLTVYVGLMILVALIGIEVNGSKAWLNVGIGTLQPSEFGKPLQIAFLGTAAWNGSRHKKLQDSFFRYWRLPLILLAISVFFLLFLQKDLGSMIITVMIGCTGMLVPRYPGLRKYQNLIIAAAATLLLAYLVVILFSDQVAAVLKQVPMLAHVAIRIENMHDPYLAIHDSGYQPATALYSIADAGFFGKGLGSSIRKYGFLTQAESDYILAVVIEETGILGLGLITAGYSVLIWRLMHWARKGHTTADRVTLTSCAAYLAFHFFVNVGGVSSLIPMTGVPLLLISAGGSSLLSICIAMGIAQCRIGAIRRGKEISQ